MNKYKLIDDFIPKLEIDNEKVSQLKKSRRKKKGQFCKT